MYVCVCVCVCVGVNHAGRQMGRQADLHLRRLPPALADYLEHIAVIIIRHSRHEGHIIGLTVIQETIHGIAVEVVLRVSANSGQACGSLGKFDVQPLALHHDGGRPT
jgi:hypothetical protein